MRPPLTEVLVIIICVNNSLVNSWIHWVDLIIEIQSAFKQLPNWRIMFGGSWNSEEDHLLSCHYIKKKTVVIC